MVVVWNTQRVSKGGEVTVMAKAHTDVDIQRMRVSTIDETRYCHVAGYMYRYSLNNNS